MGSLARRSRRAGVASAAAALTAAAALAGSAGAQVVLDGTLGPAGALQGPTIIVPASSGRLSGNNLFHSFSEFNVAPGELVSFTGPTNVQNVLARVTGGSPSTIDGALLNAIPGANFYLINPRGITFGPNAEVLGSGSFVATTADVVRLADGGRFDATNLGEAVLTSAPPSAFGFLGPATGRIELDGAAVQGALGRAVSLVGGEVRLTNGARASAPGGRFTIVSAAGAGEVAFDPASAAPSTPVDASALPARGRVVLDGASLVESVADDLFGSGGGGGVVVRAGELVVTGASQVRSTANGAADGGPVDVGLTGLLELAAGGSISTTANAGGRGGDVTIAADRVVVRRGALPSEFSSVSSFAFGAGAGGGDITIDAARLDLDGTRDPAAPDEPTGSANLSAVTVAAAPSGELTLRVGDTRLEGPGAGIQSFGLDPSPEAASGSVSLAGQRLVMRGGANIISRAGGSTPPGPIAVAVDEVDLANENTNIIASANDLTEATGGVAGGVAIVARTVSLADFASVSSFTLRQQPGNVVVLASEAVRLSGRGEISASTFADARGGDVIVQTPLLEMTGGAVTAEAGGAGDAGNILVSGPEGEPGAEVRLDASSRISGGSVGGGDAGVVLLDVTNLTVRGGSAVLAAARNFGSGEGGERAGNGSEVLITATGDVVVGGASEPTDAPTLGVSSISSDVILSGGNAVGGTGGRVQVFARNVLLEEGGRISTSSRSLRPAEGPDLALATGVAGVAGRLGITAEGAVIVRGRAPDNPDGSPGRASGIVSEATLRGPGSGGAGAIAVVAGRVDIDDGGQVSVRSTGSGDAGELGIAAVTGPVRLTRGAAVTSSAELANGSNVAIASVDSVFINGASVTALAPNGNGGSIRVVARNRIRLTDGQVVTRAGGTGGNIAIGDRDIGTRAINPFVILFDASEINASAVRGNGGNIDILSDEYVTSSDTLVTASSEQSDPGEVDVSAAYTELAGGLVRLPGAFSNEAARLQERCGLAVQGAMSSFIATGRGGAPVAPAGLQPSFRVRE